MMTVAEVQDRCQRGQELLAGTDYLGAERELERAEALARQAGDWDTLSRLYMPLQEARRQRRQRCGEGEVVLDLLAEGPEDVIQARHVLDNYAQGQLLVAGWGSFQPALELRKLQREHEVYLETFLGAVFPIAGGGRAVAIVPTDDVALPEPEPRPADHLLRLLPPHSLLLPAQQLPRGARKGTAETYAEVMAIWEKLHLPFLAAAEQTHEPVPRIDAFRRTIRVDYACELAHQHLSTTARELSIAKR